MQHTSKDLLGQDHIPSHACFPQLAKAPAAPKPFTLSSKSTLELQHYIHIYTVKAPLEVYELRAGSTCAFVKQQQECKRMDTHGELYHLSRQSALCIVTVSSILGRTPFACLVWISRRTPRACKCEKIDKKERG